MIDFNTDELDEKLKNIQKDEKKVQDEIQNQYLKLDKFIQSLENKIYSECLNNIPLLKNGETQEFFESMIKIIEENTKNYFNDYFVFNANDIDLGTFENMKKDLNMNQSIKLIIAEGLPFVLDKIGSVLATIPKVGIIFKGFQLLSMPLSLAGGFLANQIEKLVAKNPAEVAKMATLVVMNLTKGYIEKISNEQIFEPLKNKLQTTKDSIGDTIALKSKKIDEIKKTKKDMEKTIIELENFINS